MEEKKRRIFFLDNLKAFIVCLMIVFHVALCYMAYAPEWWYTVTRGIRSFPSPCWLCGQIFLSCR